MGVRHGDLVSHVACAMMTALEMMHKAMRVTEEECASIGIGTTKEYLNAPTE